MTGAQAKRKSSNGKSWTYYIFNLRMIQCAQPTYHIICTWHSMVGTSTCIYVWHSMVRTGNMYYEFFFFIYIVYPFWTCVLRLILLFWQKSKEKFNKNNTEVSYWHCTVQYYRFVRAGTVDYTLCETSLSFEYKYNNINNKNTSRSKWKWEMRKRHPTSNQKERNCNEAQAP